MGLAGTLCCITGMGEGVRGRGGGLLMLGVDCVRKISGGLIRGETGEVRLTSVRPCSTSRTGSMNEGRGGFAGACCPTEFTDRQGLACMGQHQKTDQKFQISDRILFIYCSFHL